MRHRKGGSKLAGPEDQRTALLRGLTSQLITHQSITTTLSRAKILRSFAEKLVTLARAGTVAARRRAIQLLPESKTINRLFADAATSFEGRAGGYTRIYKIGPRRGDNTEMARIELK